MEKRTNKNPRDYLKGMFNPLTLMWVGGLFAMVIASLMPQGGLSEMETGFGRDKVVRVITFLLLSFYPVAFFPSIRMGLILSTFIAPLGFLLEIFQKYVPGRNFSPEDMIANNIGAIIGIVLALVIRFYFRTGQLTFRKKDGFIPRAALVPEENTQTTQGDEPKETKGTSPRRFKKWRSKAITVVLLLVLGYVGWTILADQTQQKKPAENPQPPPKTSTEQPVIETETKMDMIQLAPAEPSLEKKGAATIAPSSTVFPNPPLDTVALSEPEILATPTTTPEPELMDIRDTKADSPPLAIEGSIEKSAPQKSAKKNSPGPKISSQKPVIPSVVKTFPDKKPDPAEKAITTKPLFSIRAGAFLEKQNAEKLIAELEAKGYHPYIFIARDQKDRTWYAVQLSDHENIDQAGIAATIFQKKEKTRVYITRKDSFKTVPSLSTR